MPILASVLRPRPVTQIRQLIEGSSERSSRQASWNGVISAMGLQSGQEIRGLNLEQRLLGVMSIFGVKPVIRRDASEFRQSILPMFETAVDSLIDRVLSPNASEDDRAAMRGLGRVFERLLEVDGLNPQIERWTPRIPNGLLPFLFKDEVLRLIFEDNVGRQPQFVEEIQALQAESQREIERLQQLPEGERDTSTISAIFDREMDAVRGLNALMSTEFNERMARLTAFPSPLRLAQEIPQLDEPPLPEQILDLPREGIPFEKVAQGYALHILADLGVIPNDYPGLDYIRGQMERLKILPDPMEKVMTIVFGSLTNMRGKNEQAANEFLRNLLFAEFIRDHGEDIDPKYAYLVEQIRTDWGRLDDAQRRALAEAREKAIKWVYLGALEAVQAHNRYILKDDQRLFTDVLSPFFVPRP